MIAIDPRLTSDGVKIVAHIRFLALVLGMAGSSGGECKGNVPCEARSSYLRSQCLTSIG